MKRRSIWVLIGLLIVITAFALTGCRPKAKPAYKLSATELSLTVGNEEELLITPTPEGSVTWESGDESVATVKDGTVRAIKEGKTTITAEIEGAELPLRCIVTVKAEEEPVKPTTDCTLDISSVSLKTGETKQIHVLTKDGEIAQSAEFSSENESVATVSADGLITAVAAGETNIIAKIDGAELVCKVSVAQKYTYALDCDTLDIAAGASGRITLITTPDGNESTRPHTFMSSDESVATVDGGTGKVTGISKGTATITCLVDGEELTATVIVTEYTVTIDGKALSEETELRAGTETPIEVTASPDREFTPVYESGDESIATVADGSISALKEGSTYISVTVGGREFRTTVTVLPAVVYTINEDEATLSFGATDNTLQLVVTRDPAGEFEVTYSSSDPDIVSVDEEGLITAEGLGTATVTTSVTGTEFIFTTTVRVVMPSSLAHEDYTFGSGAVNLTRLDENKTLDWRYYYNYDNIPTRMKDNAGLIGDYTMINCDDERFWDYKAPIVFEDAEGDKSGSYTYGRAVHGSFTIPVIIDNRVSKVVILTGSWKETATIEFSIGGSVLQSETFVGGEIALARKYELTLDTSALEDGQTVELTITVDCPRTNGGNVSLVAVAAIGKTAHETAVSATATAQVTTGLTGVQDLTAAGTIDWLSANGTKKAGVPENAVIGADNIVYDPNKGSANDYPGATFTWTDGTASAPAGLAAFLHSDNSVTIPVQLEKGKTTVTLFATGWNCGYFVAVYDTNGIFVNGYQGADEKSQQSVSSKIAITVDAEEAGIYTFRIMKCRGVGNCGWAAIAVSGANGFEPEKTVYDLSAGEKADIVLTGDGAVSAASYESDNPEVADVDENGRITAGKAGIATVSVTVEGVTRKIFVTVTEYLLASESEISLFVGGTSKIQVVSNPQGHEFAAIYTIVEGGEEVVRVSEEGMITALKAGVAEITVEVGGKAIGTITVTVANYELNATQHTIVTASGTDSFTLQVIDTVTDSVVEPSEIVFESHDEDIVTVGADGVIRAVGVGTAVVTATCNNTVLECEITVVTIPVTTQSIEYEEGKDYTVNLSMLDETNETLDWHYFGNNMTDRKKGGSLIGELSAERSALFYDYRVKVNWADGTTRETSYADYTSGWTFKNSVSFTVKLTSDVEYIAVFTGAYHAKNIIEVKVGDAVHAVYEFSNRGDSDKTDKNKQFRIYPDVSLMTQEQTITVTLTCGAEPDHGWTDNISLVAIAVVGKEARTDKIGGTASAEVTPLMPAEANVIDLTQTGTLDWVYAKNGSGGLARKAGVPENSVIKENEIVRVGGDGYDYFGNRNQYFSWTDGTSALEGDRVNNFQWINEKYYIPVRLPKGESEVTLYLSGWKCSYFVSVLDAYGNKLIDAHQVVAGDGVNSQAAAVKITVNASETGTFTFVMTKQEDGNHGWAAVAVAQKTAYSVAQNAFDITLGGALAGQIDVLKDGAETTDEVNFVSGDESIVKVAADGTLTAVGAGSAVITVEVGGTQFFVYVTVTDYILDSPAEVVLPLQATSQIVIMSNPSGDFTAEYVSDDEGVASVSDTGLITAVAEGETVITITVGGKTLTVQVKVEAYRLSDEQVLLKAGEGEEETYTLSVLNGAGDPVTGSEYDSSDPDVVEVNADGLLTAHSVGEAIITVTTENGVELFCEVVVSIPDTESVYTELDMSFENLSRVSAVYETIDYKHWYSGGTVTMPGGAGLIGEPSSTVGNFWDYKATIGYEFAIGGKNLGMSYGKTSKNFEIPVTINNGVSEIVFYTGAYHGAATISFMLDGRVFATKSFEADQGVARKIALPVDTSKMTQDLTLIVAGEFSGQDDGNVNVVALAVVGKTPYSGAKIAAGSAVTAVQQITGDKGSNKVDLTAVGTLDWTYSQHDGTPYRMFGSSQVISGEVYYDPSGRETTAGKEWDGFSAFKWTNGMQTGTEATEGTVNPADVNNESWEGHDEYTNNYCTASGEIHIGLSLIEGRYQITAYLNSWKAAMSVAIYDGNHNFIAGKLLKDDSDDSTGWVVTFTLDVTSESEFSLVIGKSRSHDENRQVGWQAIAVAALPAQEQA